MTTDAICEERGSDWSHQVSVVATTQWLECDQTLCEGCGSRKYERCEDVALPLPTHTSTYVDGLFKSIMISFIPRLVPAYAQAWERGYHTTHKTIALLPGTFYLIQYILEETKCIVRAGLYEFFIKSNINKTILAFY